MELILIGFLITAVLIALAGCLWFFWRRWQRRQEHKAEQARSEQARADCNTVRNAFPALTGASPSSARGYHAGSSVPSGADHSAGPDLLLLAALYAATSDSSARSREHGPLVESVDPSPGTSETWSSGPSSDSWSSPLDSGSSWSGGDFGGGSWSSSD